MSNKNSILYLVATPIGNLGDITLRALEVLRAVDLIAAEDTRRSRLLLQHYGVQTPLVSLHEHNEESTAPLLLRRLLAAESIALISDAGTPLISDPGYPLVRMARAAGIAIAPVPGCCALIAALCASGLPGERFCFEGFPPRSAGQRKRYLQGLVNEPRTLVFYESSHRIEAFLDDLRTAFPGERPVAIARELTKLHETIVNAALEDAPRILAQDPDMRKGEFVIVVQGAPAQARTAALAPEEERVLRILLTECSVSAAVALAARITGAARRKLYERALDLTRADA